MTNLQDTAPLMASEDYKDRFLAEYHQLNIRYQKISNMIQTWDKGELLFIPTCPREIYNFQLRAMKEYLDILVIRAQLEGIEIK